MIMRINISAVDKPDNVITTFAICIYYYPHYRIITPEKKSFSYYHHNYINYNDHHADNINTIIYSITFTAFVMYIHNKNSINKI